MITATTEQCRMREPGPKDPHRPFWEHVRRGGRVWRDDRHNNEQGWIDLASLGGDANAIQRFGYADLSIPAPEQGVQELPANPYDHIVGFVAGRPVHQSKWHGAIKQFGLKVCEFNQRSQREQVPHPGFAERNNFCPTCGSSLQDIVLEPLRLPS